MAIGSTPIDTPGPAPSLPDIALVVPTLPTAAGAWGVYVPRSAGTYIHVVLQATAPLSGGNDHHNGRSFRTVTIDASETGSGTGVALYDGFDGAGQLLAHNADTGQSWERFTGLDPGTGSILASSRVRSYDFASFDYLATGVLAPSKITVPFHSFADYGEFGVYMNAVQGGSAYASWKLRYNSFVAKSIFFFERRVPAGNHDSNAYVIIPANSVPVLTIEFSGLDWTAKIDGTTWLTGTLTKAVDPGRVGLVVGSSQVQSDATHGYQPDSIEVLASVSVDVRSAYEAAWFPIGAARAGQVVWWRSRAIDASGNVTPWMYVKSILQ